MWQVKKICRRELGAYSSSEDGETFETNREGDPQQSLRGYRKKVSHEPEKMEKALQQLSEALI